MSSWALFYTSVFEGTKSAVVDVGDPDGLVRSQVLRSGGLRITLNGADQRRTLAGQFVEQSSGSAVQHIAFACGDIFATVAALIRLGFPVLPIGANYYEDLRVRFGLEPRVMARLKAFNILYDEDAGGTFHQFYSAARPEGLFFEIVARSGTYQGFGAGNAPFRIAAQKRSRKALGLAGDSAFGGRGVAPEASCPVPWRKGLAKDCTVTLWLLWMCGHSLMTCQTDFIPSPSMSPAFLSLSKK